MAKRMVFIPPNGPYIEVEDTPPTGSAAPNQIGSPPQLDFLSDEDAQDYARGVGVDKEWERERTAAGAMPDFSNVQAGHSTTAPDFSNVQSGFSSTAPNFSNVQAGHSWYQAPSYAPSASAGGGFQNSYGLQTQPYTSRPGNTSDPWAGWASGGGGGGGQQAVGKGSTGTIAPTGQQQQQQGTMGGGGGMAQVQQFANLDPTKWGQDATGTGIAGAQSAAAGLMGINPQVGAAPRTLYDKYQGLLMDPSSMMQDQNFGFMLDRAQEAARRQLAAGGMRHSGRALEELAGVTQGTMMQQFGNLANIYGQGAGAELGRYGTEQGLGLQAAGIRADALGRAGQLSLGGGELGRGMSALDLQRVQSGIRSPTEDYRLAQAAAANPFQPYTTASISGQPGYGYGGAAPRDLGSYGSWVTTNWGLR